MRWLAIVLVLFVGIFTIWYFFVPDYVLNQEYAQTNAADPVRAAIDTLFIAAEPVTDRAGNVYPTVMVHGQRWMAANLRTTGCNADDGTKMSWADGGEKAPHIPLYSMEPKYGYYDGNAELGYGVLYTYGAVERCQLCPEGWRVANKKDWEILFAAIGPESFRGKKLKASAGSPFNAPLGGRVDGYGAVLAGRFQFWWTLDAVTYNGYGEAWGAELKPNGEVAIIPQAKRTANYVRCVEE